MVYPRNYLMLALLIVGIGCFALSVGDVASFSPYTLLRKLPIFSSTRVSARWLPFAGLMLLFFIATYRQKKYRKLINFFLLAAVVQLGINDINMLRHSFPFPSTIKSSYTQGPPRQLVNYGLPRKPYIPYDGNLYQAQVDNVDQLSTILTPFFDTKDTPTPRCAETAQSCKFVVSNNATVISWSPNKILLKRTHGTTDPILLNINPSRYWLINERYTFGGPATNPYGHFFIYDTSDVISIKFAPPSSISWLRHRLSL